MKETFEFSSHPENLAAARAFVRRFLHEAALSEQEIDLLVHGVDEACSNIIRHAYDHVPSEPITLCCERLHGSIRFKLRDYGRQADPKRMDGRPLDRIEPGGLGLHLIRNAFDEVDYNLMKLGTELVLLKRLRPDL